MQYPIKRFKSLKICLNELAPFIRNGDCLETGREFKNFGNLRPREIWANWLICAAIESEYEVGRLRVCTDPQGSDGIIYDAIEGISYQTEHVLVSRRSEEKELELLILKQIEKKQAKGEAYGSGKELVIFINKHGGIWSPIRIARKLPRKINFQSIWAVGLEKVINSEYRYYVSRLYPNGCPVWKVSINKEFKEWRIQRIQ